MPSTLTLLLALLLAAADGATLWRGRHGDAPASSEEEGAEDTAPARATLDGDLATALRDCMDHYDADRGTAASQCHQGTPPRRTAADADRRRGPRGRRNPPGGPAGGTDSPPGGRPAELGWAAAIRSWVTYYGELPAGPPPRGANKAGDHWDTASVCAVHCAFVRTQLVSRAGLPDEALLSKRLEDSIEEPRLRLAAMRNAATCFARLGAVREADDDPCQYTTKLAKCMGMQVVKEYVKMKNS